MADKFTKMASPSSPSPSADAWKDAQVEKEHQPAKQKTQVTYRQLENRITQIDSQIVNLNSEKTSVEAEMAKVKTAAES